MEILTTRFGTLSVAADATLRFPSGLPGFEECRAWVLLADPRGPDLAWLQSIERPEVALAVVDPRRYVEEYDLRTSRGQLALVGLSDSRDAQVLAIVSGDEAGLTLNLMAPVVINSRRRLGRQLVNKGEWPIRFSLGAKPLELRRAA